MRCILVLALLVAGGCGKSKRECRADAEAAGALLVEAAKEAPLFLTVADDVRLVTREDLGVSRDVRAAPVVTLTPTRISLAAYSVLRYTPADQPVADLAALEPALREARAAVAEDVAAGRFSPRWAPDPRRVYFSIDPETSWDRVVGAVEAARRAGLTAPAFVFEQPSRVAPPPRTSIDAKLDAIMKEDPAERATRIAKLTQDLVADCPPLVRSFGAVAGVDGEDKGMTLAREVAPSLIECNCAVDLPDLRAVMFRVLHVPRPLRVIAFDPDARSAQIELAGATTWAAAARRFTPATRNAALVTAP